MKGSRYYYRKAEALRECGHWAAADELKRLARKTRNAERRRKCK